ncbi:dihydroneopterin aldolase [Meridianimarinicoccus sp. RP-17]|uniref:dihydroneopterin aldolase n=1 Tax=Meridianimarinicoccus zhengii TaxID=2056810 RepID=UPI001C9B2E13|nr:dihydroneopterin aldolase [Phycocomes zhengii]
MTRPTLLHPASLPDAGQAPANTPPDRIFLRDHVVEAEIGAFQAERGVRQRVRFTIVADLAPHPVAAGCDDVDTILSYDLLLDAIRAEMMGRRINLLETLAEGIAARVLAHGGVAAVHVTIEKLDRVPGTLGVEITRTRPRAVPLEALPVAVPENALVALLDGAALAVAHDLSARLDALVALGPAVLCVDAPGAPRGHVPAAVQRRLDLLAFEQAAWRLAARDPRCVVVDSRTELDWGLRNGQVSVWAPSKIVVDARDDTPPAPLAMAALAPWLARRLGIGRMARLGAAGLEVANLD